MRTKNYKAFFLFVITITILIVSIQVYWNYEMYKTNKSQYIFSAERAFDKAIDAYYFQLGKSDVISIMDSSPNEKEDSLRGKKFLEKKPINKLLPLFKKMDSTKDFNFKKLLDSAKNEEGITYATGKEAMDDNIMSNFKINAVTITTTRDSLDYTILHTITDSILKTYTIKSSYNIYHYKKDSIFDSRSYITEPANLLSHVSKSEYIPRGQKIELRYNNVERQALLKGIIGLILSLVLSLGIIISILRLIKTIQKQKKLAALKDDFISNITHEFKTPIATVSAAIEALENFNINEHPEKVKRYLKTSGNQLKKLDFMVEKLLETSALETENITLNKEKIDLIALCKATFDKYELIDNNKNLSFKTSVTFLERTVDTFYFSSALSNLLDNAIKYGGSDVALKIEEVNQLVKITIEDNGSSLEKSDGLYIFDKFSRKPKGNLHDIKGSGIGLYFTKKVIALHNGSLALDLTKNTTKFIISL